MSVARWWDAYGRCLQRRWRGRGGQVRRGGFRCRPFCGRLRRGCGRFAGRRGWRFLNLRRALFGRRRRNSFGRACCCRCISGGRRRCGSDGRRCRSRCRSGRRVAGRGNGRFRCCGRLCRRSCFSWRDGGGLRRRLFLKGCGLNFRLCLRRAGGEECD